MYQISINAFDCGRNIPRSKRCIKWRFGFEDEESCGRGKEHEVTLIWSITSGKRIVKFDGDQVHFFKGKRAEKIRYAWEWNDLQLEVVAYAAPPIRATEGFCLNDLFINGISFNLLKAIHEIGKDRNDVDPEPAEANEFNEPTTETNVRAEQKDEQESVAEVKDNTTPCSDKTSPEDCDSDDDDDSFAPWDEGLLDQTHISSHDFKTEDINPNQPPSLEDLELENSDGAKDEQTNLSYEQVWGKLSHSKNTKKSSPNSNRKSPTSVSSFGAQRRSPSRRVKRNLSSSLEKLKLNTPNFRRSPIRVGRKSSSYKELSVR